MGMVGEEVEVGEGRKGGCLQGRAGRVGRTG